MSVMGDKEFSSPSSRRRTTTKKLSKLPKLLSSSNKKSPNNTTTLPVNSFSRGDAVEDAAVSGFPSKHISLSRSNSNATKIPTHKSFVKSSKVVTSIQPESQESHPLLKSKMDTSASGSASTSTTDRNNLAVSTEQPILTPDEVIIQSAAKTEISLKLEHLSEPASNTKNADSGTACCGTEPGLPLPEPEIIPLPVTVTVTTVTKAEQGSSKTLSKQRKSLLPLPKTSKRTKPDITPVHGATLVTRSRTISHANPNNSSNLNNSRLTPPECKIQSMPSKSGIPNASEIPLSTSKIRINLNGSTKTGRKIPTLIPSSKKLNLERANTSLGNLENRNINNDNRNIKINSVSSLSDKKSKLPRLNKPKSDKTITKTTSSAQKLPSQNTQQSLMRKKSMHTNNLLHPSMKTNHGGGANSSKSNNKDKCGGEAEAKFSYSQRFKQLQTNSAKNKGKTVSPKVSQNAEIELKRESKTSTLSTLPLQKTGLKPKQSNSADKIGSTKVTPNPLIRDEDANEINTTVSPIKVKYTPSKESTFTVKTPGTSRGEKKKKDKSGGTIVGIFETPSPLLLDTSESDSDFNKDKSKSELDIKKSFSLKEIWPKLDGRKSSSGKDGLNGVESPSFNESFSDFEFLELPMKGFGFKSKTKRSSSVLHPADGQIEANLSSNNSHCGTTALSPCESDLQKLQTLVVVECPQLSNNEDGKETKSKGTITKLSSSADDKATVVTAEKDLLKAASLNSAEPVPAIPEPFIANQKGSQRKVAPEPQAEMKTPASASGSNHLIQFSSEEALDIQRRLQCPSPKAASNNSNKDLLEEGTKVCSTSRHLGENQQVAPLIKLLTVPVPSSSMDKDVVVLLEAEMPESNLNSNLPVDNIRVKKDNEKVSESLVDPPQSIQKKFAVFKKSQTSQEIQNSTPIKSIVSELFNTETKSHTKQLPVSDPAPLENSVEVCIKEESNSAEQVQQTSKPTSTLTNIKSTRSRANSSIPTSTRSRGGKSEKSNLNRNSTEAKVNTDTGKTKGEPEMEINPVPKTAEVSSMMPTQVVASEIAVPSTIVKKSMETFSINTSSNLSKHIHSSLSISTGDSSSTSSCDSFKSAQTPETTSTCSLRMSQTMPLTLSSVSLKVAKLLSQNALTSGSGTALTPSLAQTQSTPKIIENTNSNTQQLVQPLQFPASSKQAVATSSETNPLGSATATAVTSISMLKQKSKDSTKIPKKLKSIEIQSKTALELHSSSLQTIQTEINPSPTITSTLSGKVSATPHSHLSMILTPKVKVHEVQVTDPDPSAETPVRVLAKLPISSAETSPPRQPSLTVTGELRGQGQNCVDQIPVVISAKIPSEISKIDPHKSSCTFLKAPKSVKSNEKLGKEHSENSSAHKELEVSEAEMDNTADKLKLMESKTKTKEVLILAAPSPTLVQHSNNGLNPSQNNSSLPVEIKSLRKRKMSSENSFPLTPNNTPNSSNFNSATSTIATECTLSAVEVQQRIYEDDEEKALLPQIESVGSLHSACMSCRIESLNSIISTTHSNTNCSSPFRGCDPKALVSRISETMDETLIEEIRAARRQSIQQFELKQQLARHVMIDQAVSMYSVGSHLEGFLRIQNKSSLSICYRVTSLVAGRYQIIPFSGKLEPMETVSITVASAHPSKFLKREASQFKVEAALGPPDVVTPSEQRLFWKEISRHQIYETSVEVVRILHPNHPTFDDSLNDESGSNDVPSGDGIVQPAKQLKSQVRKISLPTTTASIGLYTVALGLVAAALHQCSSALDQF